MQHFCMGSSTCKLRIGRKVRVSKVDVLRTRHFVSRLAYYPIYLPNFSTPIFTYTCSKRECGAEWGPGSLEDGRLYCCHEGAASKW